MTVAHSGTFTGYDVVVHPRIELEHGINEEDVVAAWENALTLQRRNEPRNWVRPATRGSSTNTKGWGVRYTTNDEKIALFERAGITDEFIDETERQITTGAFLKGSWTTVETHEPAIVQIEMDPVVVTLDRKARAYGMTRSQYISALATS